MILLALFAVACDAPRETAAERNLRSCAPYAAMSDVYGACVSRTVAHLRTIDAVEQLCASAGDWEDHCRHVWVAAQDRTACAWTLDELLRACGDNEDCAFQVLDAHAVGDVVSQVAQCERHAPSLAIDCVRHTAQRWAFEVAIDEQEAARVIQALRRYPEQVGTALALADVCKHTVSCDDGDDPAWKWCRAERDGYRKLPDRCRPRVNPNALPKTTDG